MHKDINFGTFRKTFSLANCPLTTPIFKLMLIREDEVGQVRHITRLEIVPFEAFVNYVIWKQSLTVYPIM